jgi:hypothetical protein
MKRLVSMWVALCLGLVPQLALGAEKPVTLLFTGDNGGDVAPCG